MWDERSGFETWPGQCDGPASHFEGGVMIPYSFHVKKTRDKLLLDQGIEYRLMTTCIYFVKPKQ